MSDVTRPGRELAARFQAIGNMTGMSRDEIIRLVGSPNSISSMNDGQLLQWIVTGYHISIMFDNDGMFSGISHEFGNFEPAPSAAGQIIGWIIGIIFLLGSSSLNSPSSA